MRGFLLGFLLLALAGCGFHLRGQGADGTFVAASAYVVGPGGTAKQLKKVISALPEVALLKAAAPDAVQIDILQEGSHQQVLTLNSAGRVSEYRLFYVVNFRARMGDAVWIDNGVISLYRDYTYDDNNVLGKNNEADALITNMQQDAAFQIIRRINATARHQEATSASATVAASTPAADAR
ncbi:LPS-assembly lipoprotein LptE [Andreprevotia sp. IGB-42]|uniref:LPS-assembly lipoprotein LptE n=1 Tax=Andreprevotia sp. IGB-42 TaxID=2497473 RepID=UPI00135ADE2A|nr:LPS assembly lipoprotein LptE [Andreprevotia sp. IGB-42]KAF0811418.1 LPS-assembly lipoprotein LptE [Andreprevotia sp. IGB-42]